MDPVEAILDAFILARKQTHLNLTLSSLVAPETGEPDYSTPEEALSRTAVEITEVSGGRRSPSSS